MKNEIQNNDITLPGGLGTVGDHEIVQRFTSNEGAVTLTIKPRIEWGEPVDSDWECYQRYKKEFYPNAKLIEPKQLP